MKLIIFDFDGVFIDTVDASILQVLKDVLKNLYQKYILAIVSSTSNNTIKKILEREGILSYFKDILGFENYTSKVVKNKMLLEKYKITSQDAVFITDTVGDIIEARDSGIKSIAVTWGFHEEERLQKANPEKIVNNPEDLLKAIQELLS